MKLFDHDQIGSDDSLGDLLVDLSPLVTEDTITLVKAPLTNTPSGFVNLDVRWKDETTLAVEEEIAGTDYSTMEALQTLYLNVIILNAQDVVGDAVTAQLTSLTGSKYLSKKAASVLVGSKGSDLAGQVTSTIAQSLMKTMAKNFREQAGIVVSADQVYMGVGPNATHNYLTLRLRFHRMHLRLSPLKAKLPAKFFECVASAPKLEKGMEALILTQAVPEIGMTLEKELPKELGEAVGMKMILKARLVKDQFLTYNKSFQIDDFSRPEALKVLMTGAGIQDFLDANRLKAQGFLQNIDHKTLIYRKVASEPADTFKQKVLKALLRSSITCLSGVAATKKEINKKSYLARLAAIKDSGRLLRIAVVRANNLREVVPPNPINHLKQSPYLAASLIMRTIEPPGIAELSNDIFHDVTSAKYDGGVSFAFDDGTDAVIAMPAGDDFEAAQAGLFLQLKNSPAITGREEDDKLIGEAVLSLGTLVKQAAKAFKGGKDVCTLDTTVNLFSHTAALKEAGVPKGKLHLKLSLEKSGKAAAAL